MSWMPSPQRSLRLYWPCSSVVAVKLKVSLMPSKLGSFPMHQLELKAQFKGLQPCTIIEFPNCWPQGWLQSRFWTIWLKVESHALHSKGLEPKVSAVMILTSHTGGCPSHIDYILAHMQATSSKMLTEFGEPRMLWSHGSISPSLGFVPLQPCSLL